MEQLNDQESLKEEKGLFNLGIDAFEAIIKNGLTLDQIYILEMYSKGIDVMAEIPGSRTLGWKTNLVRKGYLTDRGEVTPTGKLILGTTNIVDGLKERKKLGKETKDKVLTDFDIWWKTYPASDYFEHKGKTFAGVQNKRIGKDNCRELFNQIVVSEDIKAADIIEATKRHIEVAKELSWKKGENQLTYITNSERYLRLRSFAPFIGMKPSNSPKTITGGVDI